MNSMIEKQEERELENKIFDKTFRLNNFYKIVNTRKQVIVFRLNRAQKDFHERKTKRNIILKSRKLGFTTYEAIDGLDDTLFEKNTEALMLSYDIPSQLDIFDNKIKFPWDNFDEDLKANYVLDADRANKLKFNWGDGSTSSITVRSRGRSGTFNRLHISEFAKICKEDPSGAKEIISGTIQAVPLDGRVDIESTAEEDIGEFYTMFMEAWNRGAAQTPVDFTAFFYNWTYDDEELSRIIPRSEEELPKEFNSYREEHGLSLREITYYYYKWLTLNRDWRALRREYPTTPEEAFASAGDKYFDTKSIDKMKTREPVTEVSGWRYFADYRPGHRYACGVDPAEGLGLDNSVISIIDFDAKTSEGVLRPEVVAMYVSDRVPPDSLAYVARDGGSRYGNCLIGVERNNHGHTTLAILKGIYYNIYTEKKTDAANDIDTARLGWHTNAATKPMMLSSLNTAINEMLINVPDKDSVTELRTFPRQDATVFSKGKDENAKHWDRVMAIAIAWQMKDHARTNKITITDSGGDFDKFSPINSL